MASKEHSNVAPPAHFKVRPDLIEELCVADAMQQTLPRTPERYLGWCRLCGFRPNAGTTYERLKPYFDRPYEPTNRYVLHPSVLAGTAAIANVISDRHGWSVCCPPGGLYDFVLNRAVEFAVTHGQREADVIEALWPAADKNDDPYRRRQANWSVGYECHSGLCTIILRTDPETETSYLHGFGGYHVVQFGLASDFWT